MNLFFSDWLVRLKASAIHFLGSSFLIGTFAFFAFKFWYPHPFETLSGGRNLFLLLATCDLIVGPVITFIIFNKNKNELKFDIFVIIFFQILALGYGAWSIFIARPVYIIFERDLYRIVRTVDIPIEKLSSRPLRYSSFPISGPVLLSLRDFSNAQEQMNTTFLELGGLPMSAQPEFWQEYSKSRVRVLKYGKPVDDLLLKFPKNEIIIKEAIKKSSLAKIDLIYLSFVDRENYWTVLVDKKSLNIVAYLPIDSYI